MARSPYPGFTALNRRRHALIDKEFGGGLNETEARELEMLQKIVGLMCDFRWPHKKFPKHLEETIKRYTE